MPVVYSPQLSDTRQRNRPKQMTTTQIEILAESPSLVKYTHCQARHAAESLAELIRKIESQGFNVLGATSCRSAVPTCYRSAYKMSAPFYIFDAATCSIRLVNGQLETRPRGATIPAHFEVAGSVVPDGFRCFKRNADSIVIRHK